MLQIFFIPRKLQIIDVYKFGFIVKDKTISGLILIKYI